MDSKCRENEITSLGEACCGCGACSARCPKGCIAMEPDVCGFLRPAIDVDACIGCGACDAVCPVLNLPAADSVKEALWAKADDANLLDRSSSGGVFGLLARDVLSRGGVVAGAAWSEDCRELRHVIIEHEEDLDLLMRSKYVQSSIGREVYEGVRDALRAERPTLFCGTACQVAGIRSYLGKTVDSDLFLGIDVMCHGVPSPELWRRWLGYVGEREGGEVHEVNFRSKTTGWSSYSVIYEYMTEKDGFARTCATVFRDDWYMRAFLSNASLRASCLSCPFKRKCGSDTTLGDFWGVQRQHPEVSTDGGVSAVLCNTRKGLEAFSRISEYTDSGASTFGKVVAGNSALVHPVQPYSGRDEFMVALAAGSSIPEIMGSWDFEPTRLQKIASAVKAVMKKLIVRK